MSTPFASLVNNGQSTLGSAYTAASGTLTLAAGYGAVLAARLAAAGFAAVGSSAPLRFTVIKASALNVYGQITDLTKMTIFEALSLSADMLGGVSAVEGTTDQNFAAGDAFVVLLTAGQVQAMQSAIAALQAAGGSSMAVGGGVAGGTAGDVLYVGAGPVLAQAAITGLLKWSSSGPAAAVAGTDYLAPSGNGSALTGLTVSQVSGAAPLASPSLTGTPTAPTPSTADNSTKIATTAYVQAQSYDTVSAVAAYVTGLGYAPLASPTLTGTPAAPTPSTADNSTKLATTAYVQAQGYVTATSAPVTSVGGNTGAVTVAELVTAGLTPLASPAFTGNVSLNAGISGSTVPICTVQGGQTGYGLQNLFEFNSDGGVTFLVYTGSTWCSYTAASQTLTVTNTIVATSTLQTNAGGSVLAAHLKGRSIASHVIDLDISGYDARIITGSDTDVALLLQAHSATQSADLLDLCVFGTTTPTSWVDATAIIHGPTATAGTSTTQLATTAFVATSFAPLASPALTGTPTAPTATVGTNTTQLATTAFVIANAGSSSTANQLFYGSGQDGNYTVPSGGFTLTRDMYWNNLTLNGTSGVLKPSNFRIFVAGTLDISAANSGAIVGTVLAGAGNGSGSSGGSGGSVTNAIGGTTSLGAAGVAGAAGATGNGSNGVAVGAVLLFNANTSATGGAAGAGGTGSAGTGAAGATNQQASYFYRFESNTKSPLLLVSGPAGNAGGGGGGDGTNAGGGGGQGGVSPSMIWISAAVIARGTNSNAAIVQCKGGNGGNGSTPGAGNAGGGGGGSGAGGGTVLIYYGSITGSAITNAIDVTGGTGGNGGSLVGSGANGNGGGGGPGGYAMLMNLSTGAIAEYKGASAVAANTGGTTAGKAATTSQCNL